MSEVPPALMLASKCVLRARLKVLKATERRQPSQGCFLGSKALGNEAAGFPAR